MDKKGERIEQVFVGSMLASTIVYNTVRHPVKTFRLVFQGVGWYD
jgi:hypothetical protein